MDNLEGQISLADFLDDGDVQEGRFIPDKPIADDTQASSALRQLASVQKQMDANKQMADHERGRITAWEDEVNSPLAKKAAVLNAFLKSYAVRERQKSDRKTIKLPYGTLTTRPVEAKIRFTDEEAFITWAWDQNIADLVRVKQEPALNIIKSSLTVADGHVMNIDGEVAPGAVVDEPDEPFSVTVKVK